LDLSRLPPLARTRTLPNSRVQRVAIRLLSLQSVVRSTSATAFSADMCILKCVGWASFVGPPYIIPQYPAGRVVANKPARVRAWGRGQSHHDRRSRTGAAGRG